MTDREIADRLGYSYGTVQVYIDDLKRHFGTRDRFEVLQHARRAGIVSVPKVDRARANMLSPREKRCLALLRQGVAIRDLANFLGISRAQVDRIRQSVRRKFGTRTDSESVKHSVTLGVLPKRHATKDLVELGPFDRKILTGLARGKSQSAVARSVGMAASRVSIRLSVLRAAWHADDVFDLLQIARKRGIIASNLRLPPRPEPNALRPSYMKALYFMNRGSSYVEIARALKIEVQTVRTYAMRLYDHFGVYSQRELVIAARSQGVVPNRQRRRS